MSEVPTRIEPCLVGDTIPSAIANLIVDITSQVAVLDQIAHPDSASELADFVRVMNCYYSNLIEGHKTRPADIERALAGAELDPAIRPLALEAKAHVNLQRQIDRLALAGTLPKATSADFIRWLHRAFYDDMPDDFATLPTADGKTLRIRPGEYRKGESEHVSVGRHLPPSPGALGSFMSHFEWRFDPARLGPAERIAAIASAHHRFNYIHPFLDGNGRVSRLMSHAMALQAGIGAKGLWSISRGLARGLKERGEYLRMMEMADMPRRGDLDGRGNLSLSALVEFTEWFLLVILDQIRFSVSLFDFAGLEHRYRRLIGDVVNDRHAPDIVAGILRFGSIERGRVALLTSASERTARNSVSELVRAGFLKSASAKTPLRIAFPMAYRERLFPNLFADGEPPAGPDAGGGRP